MEVLLVCCENGHIIKVYIVYINEFLFTACDATAAFELVHHNEEARQMMKGLYVGQYVDVCINIVHKMVSYNKIDLHTKLF